MESRKKAPACSAMRVGILSEITNEVDISWEIYCPDSDGRSYQWQSRQSSRGRRRRRHLRNTARMSTSLYPRWPVNCWNATLRDVHRGEKGVHGTYDVRLAGVFHSRYVSSGSGSGSTLEFREVRDTARTAGARFESKVVAERAMSG